MQAQRSTNWTLLFVVSWAIFWSSFASLYFVVAFAARMIGLPNAVPETPNGWRVLIAVTGVISALIAHRGVVSSKKSQEGK